MRRSLLVALCSVAARAAKDAFENQSAIVASAMDSLVDGHKLADAIESSWSTSPAPTYDDYKGKIDTAMKWVSATKTEISDPNMQNTAEWLQEAGGVVSILPLPEVSAVVGAGLYLAGGILGLFAPASAPQPTTPTGPTNQELYDAMHKSFAALHKSLQSLKHHIDVKLDEIKNRIGDLVSAVKRLQGTVDAIGSEVFALYEDIHLHVQDLGKVNDVYLVSMEKLGYAMSDDDNLTWNDFRDYVVKKRDDLSDIVNGAFDPNNVHALLSHAMYGRQADFFGKCAAALTFKSVIASRWKLYWLLTTGALFKLSSSSEINGYAKKLHDHLAAYVGSAEKLDIKLAATRSDQELSGCLRIQPSSDRRRQQNVMLGLKGSNACPNNWAFVNGSNQRVVREEKSPDTWIDQRTDEQLQCDKHGLAYHRDSFVPGYRRRSARRPATFLVKANSTWEAMLPSGCYALNYTPISCPAALPYFGWCSAALPNFIYNTDDIEDRESDGVIERTRLSYAEVTRGDDAYPVCTRMSDISRDVILV